MNNVLFARTVDPQEGVTFATSENDPLLRNVVQQFMVTVLKKRTLRLDKTFCNKMTLGVQPRPARGPCHPAVLLVTAPCSLPDSLQEI